MAQSGCILNIRQLRATIPLLTPMSRILCIAIFAINLLFLLPRQQALQNQAFSATEEAPASIGLVLDNSKSMRDKRDAAVAAMLQLVQTAGPKDEFFVVNFNQDPHLDQDFTADKDSVKKALQRADASGGTALYDALLASGDHLRKGSKYSRKFLVLLTDGSDNSSYSSSAAVIAAFQKSDAPIVFCIGIFELGEEQGARNMLEKIAKQTGGNAYFIKKMSFRNILVRNKRQSEFA